MKQLHIDYKSLVKVPHSRRDGAFFKSKLKKHYAKLPLLFDISDKLLQASNLITRLETISSTKDIITAKVVEKKLERSEKYKKFSEAQPCDSSTGPSTSILDSSFSSQASADSGETFLPKRACTTFPSSIHIPKDIVKKMGPLADRVGTPGTLPRR